MGIVTSLLLSLTLHISVYAQDSVNLYIWDFGTRDGKMDVTTQNLTIEFEEALIQARCCSILNRRSYDKLMSQKDNEKAIMMIEGISDFSLQNLKALNAYGVIFGEVYDDIQSGDMRITVQLQTFDGKIVAQDSIRIPRGKIPDGTSRETNMQKLAEGLCKQFSQTRTAIVPEEPTLLPEQDCMAIKADGKLIEFSVNTDFEESHWRSWKEVARAIELAKKYSSEVALIYSIKEYKQDFQRFEIKKGSDLYYARASKDSMITFGSCWKKVDEIEGFSTKTNKGVALTVEKIYLYVLVK